MGISRGYAAWMAFPAAHCALPGLRTQTRGLIGCGGVLAMVCNRPLKRLQWLMLANFRAIAGWLVLPAAPAPCCSSSCCRACGG